MAGVFKAGDLVVIQMEAPEGAAPSPAVTYPIPLEGTIQLPKLEKPISVVGISCRQLTTRIDEAYQNSGIDSVPMVKSIYLGHREMESPVVIVGGEVKNSGEFPLRRGMTLLSAINRAGGFAEAAGIRRVKLIRADKETIYDRRKINPDGSNNPVLMDGDEVIVPEFPTTEQKVKPLKLEGSKEQFKLRTGTGQLKVYPLLEGETLMAAIHRAGGMHGKVRKIKLVRGGNELTFDIRKILPDGSNNPILKDGDEVIVPE